jgi:hypothetical protein
VDGILKQSSCLYDGYVQAVNDYGFHSFLLFDKYGRSGSYYLDNNLTVNQDLFEHHITLQYIKFYHLKLFRHGSKLALQTELWALHPNGYTSLLFTTLEFTITKVFNQKLAIQNTFKSVTASHNFDWVWFNTSTPVSTVKMLGKSSQVNN